MIRSPLQDARSAEEILEYDHWPSPDWFDYEVIEEQCLQIKDAGRVVVFMGDRLNRIAQLKPACYLRGFERVLIDMMENPEIARALFRKISEFYLEYGQRILEAANMDPRLLKELFGDRLCFQGGISIQKILPKGSPEDVRRHVQHVLKAMSPGGGYIACTSHNIQADTSIRNLEALFAAYRDFGRYE